MPKHTLFRVTSKIVISILSAMMIFSPFLRVMTSIMCVSVAVVHPLPQRLWLMHRWFPHRRCLFINCGDEPLNSGSVLVKQPNPSGHVCFEQFHEPLQASFAVCNVLVFFPLDV
jgi:hypothetical protein